MTGRNWTFDEPRPADLLAPPLPWLDVVRERVRAEGGASTVEPIDTMSDRLRTAVRWAVADGLVLFEDPAVPGRGASALTADALARWATWALGADEQLSPEQWSAVADQVRARVLAEHDERRAALTSDQRAAEDARAAQRVIDRRAEIAAERERLAAELADLDDGAAVPEPDNAPRERQDGGGWRFRR